MEASVGVRTRSDEGVHRRFIGGFGGFVFMRSPAESDLQAVPYEMIAVFEDYEVMSQHAGPVAAELPPIVLQLGHEACLLAVCVLRKYVFMPEPPPGSMSLAVLQSVLNLVMEYIPSYVEKMYWLEQTPMRVADPTVKLYLASLLRGLDLFLLDYSTILANAQKANKKFRSDPLPAQREVLLRGFSGLIKGRHGSCIHSKEAGPNLKLAKVHRVKTLYNARLQLLFGDAKHWQANLWTSSAVKSIAPLIVTVLDRYATPYAVALIVNRMLDVLIENAEANVSKDVAEEVKQPHRADQQTFGKIVYTSVTEEKRFSSLYGSLITSITTSLLSVVELTGLFRVVLQAVAKPLRMIFERSLGAALSAALESTTADDLKKVRFMMRMLFGDAAAQSSIHRAARSSMLSASRSTSNARDGTLEDLLSSAFDAATLDDVADLLEKIPLDFTDNPQKAEEFVTQFYETQCALKLERVVLLELSKKSKAFASLSGNYLRQVLTNLVSTLSLILRDPLLLDVLLWDYVLVHLLS